MLVWIYVSLYVDGSGYSTTQFYGREYVYFCAHILTYIFVIYKGPAFGAALVRKNAW